MKFGQVEDPSTIDFTIPPDHPDTDRVLAKSKAKSLKVYIGCAKWNKADLKNFYPKGTKDELTYYATQFNCVELNATFYRLFPPSQFEKWKNTVPDGFRFFPKLGQEISHWKRLQEVEKAVDEHVGNYSVLEDRLGATFLQMHNNFGPKDFDRVKKFVADWKYDVPLAVEFRHKDWFGDPMVANELYALLESNRALNVLVDTAGRRDMMHMRLSTPTAFVRWVGANHPSDYARLDEWIERIAAWKKKGLQELYFFVHQNVELESPLLSAYFIKRLNKKIGTDLVVPKTLIPPPGDEGTLFDV
jgi:uncharacterized protein YecE (DUF72 family)